MWSFSLIFAHFKRLVQQFDLNLNRPRAHQVTSLIRAADQARDDRDWPMAARCYADALELDPLRAGIWVQLGHALKESGSLLRAEKAYRHAIELKPDSAEHFLQLGHLLKLTGDMSGALLAYLEAERFDPEVPNIAAEIDAMRRLAVSQAPSVLDWRPGLHLAAKDRTDKPKLFFFPDYTSTNHYQTGLYSAFEPEMDVAFGNIEEAAREAVHRSVVFHLHWPEPLFGDCRTPEDFSQKAAAFWRLVSILKANGGLLFWTVHNALPHDRKFADQMVDFHKRLATEADVAHVHSQAAIEVLEALYGVEIANPVILQHGNYLDVYPNDVAKKSARAKLALPDDAFVFGFVGQIRPYKGVEALVEAFEVVQAESDRPVHLLIAGKPVWPITPGEWTARADRTDGMTVVEGFIDDDELQTFLNASDAVVLPYKDILTSGSVVMAAGFARPVLLPELPTMGEVIAQDLGPTFDPNVKDSLAAAMRAALSASDEDIARWSVNAATFAENADWGGISADLKRHAPKLENWGELNVRNHKLRVSAGGAVKPDAIGIALLTHHSAEDAGEAAAVLPDMINGRQLAVFAFDNSEDPRELSKLRRLLPEAELLTADENLGYAAGNNILLQRMRDAGCEYALIINPDIRISSEALEALFAEAAKGHIVSPLILNEAGKASFTGGTAAVGDRVVIDQIPAESDAPYTVDLLQGSAVLLPLAVLDVVGFIPEDYFLYFEETDWFLSMKGKVELRVVPEASAHHHKTSHGRTVPTLYYVYYFLRSSLIFNQKFTGSFEAAKAHYNEEFVAGWRNKIAQSSPHFLAIFDALAQAAFEDGAQGLTGRMNIQSRLDEVVGGPGTPGGIEYIEPDAIGGSTLPSYGGHERFVWVFIGDYPLFPVKANGGGAKETFSGERLQCNFRVDLPSEVLLGARAPITLRESETGARLELSKTLQRDVVRADQLHSDHFSALEALRLRKSEFRAGLNGCENGVLRGWIHDQTFPERTVFFDAVIDGATVAGQAADKPHHDPAGSGLSHPKNGFEVRPPSQLVRGKASIDVKIRPIGAAQDAIIQAVTPQWVWGDYDPGFSSEEFFRWAVLNRMTPEGAYLESSRLQRYFAISLKREQNLASETIHDLTASVVMPVFNRESTVEASIRSVLAQSCANWQLIVVDDGSEDQSVDVINRLIAENPDRDIRLVKLSPNIGVSAARNRALETATGDVVTYLDSDNVWKPDYLAIVLAALARDPERRSVYAGSEIWVRSPETGDATLSGIFANPYARSLLEERNFIDLNVFAHCRSLFEERGGFREDMKRLVDWHLILRYTKDAPPLFLPVLLAEYFIDAKANQITATVDYESNFEKIREETRLSDEFLS